MNNLENKIEAVLFWKGEPMSRKKLSEILKVGQNEINESLDRLKENLKNRDLLKTTKFT